MSRVFIVKNQHDHYLGKHEDWVDGSEPVQIFRSPHKDVALNRLIDANIKDFTLRAEVMDCDTDKNQLPLVEVLNPLPKQDPGPELEPDLAGEVMEGAEEDTLQPTESEADGEIYPASEQSVVVSQTDA